MGARRPFFLRRDAVADVYSRERELEREISRTVEGGLPGTEVLAVELLGPARFCVYIDHPRGVDHSLCERVTAVLEDYRRTYGIDVSSPGSDRPLRKPAHFGSVVGREVALRTSGDIRGRKRFRGELLAAGGLAVELELDGEPVQIPYEAIVRGNLVPTTEGGS